MGFWAWGLFLFLYTCATLPGEDQESQGEEESCKGALFVSNLTVDSDVHGVGIDPNLPNSESTCSPPGPLRYVHLMGPRSQRRTGGGRQ